MNCKQCNSPFIQNKKKQLCGDCVFKLNHKGKSKQEVYSDRSKNKNTTKLWGEEDFMNHIITGMGFIKAPIGEELKDVIKEPKKVKQKPIRQVSKEESLINSRYKAMCIDMDYTEEPICSGCGKYQGGDIKLSHSHLISRKTCKEIGRPELIYDRRNITYHCLHFSNNKGCHSIWENPKRRHELQDYERNLNIIKELAPELMVKYK